MMEAVQTSETSVNSYQSTRRYNPEDGHLGTHRRKNLESYTKAKFSVIYLSVKPLKSNSWHDGDY
jgi:hypothetical protein